MQSPPLLTVACRATACSTAPVRLDVTDKRTRGGKLAGTVFAWVSTVIFITSRVPQLVKNFSEKSFGDISVVWLLFSIVGNLSYFVSILVRDVSGTYLWRQTPFIVGAVGPAVLDSFLLLQMFIYRASSGEKEKESIHEEEKKA